MVSYLDTLQPWALVHRVDVFKLLLVSTHLMSRTHMEFSRCRVKPQARFVESCTLLLRATLQLLSTAEMVECAFVWPWYGLDSSGLHSERA